jgi:CheY-like chemotaxis protein
LPNILLIEDDRMLADAIAAALRQDGWQVDCAGDAAAARIALTDHPYTAALLDLGLPQGSGLDVLQAMRERYDATPVLIISARDQLHDRIRGPRRRRGRPPHQALPSMAAPDRSKATPSPCTSISCAASWATM